MTAKRARVMSESAAWEAIIGFLDQAETESNAAQRRLQIERARIVAVDMLGQVRRGVHENPPLLIWPNPPAGKTVQVRLDERLSKRAYELAYKHDDDRVDYKHDFSAGVSVWTGNVGRKRVVLIERPDGRELWRDF